jgi:hypothetical protein
MTGNGASRKSPDWLLPIWEKKRAETVRRVTAAVRELKRQNKAATLAGIREAIYELDGISISTNTIQRNELAYEVYLNHASAGAARKTSKCGALAFLQRTAPDEQRPALRAKIARLRRQPKDSLIAKLMELERTVEEQMKRENALREEILRVTLKASQTGS